MRKILVHDLAGSSYGRDKVVGRPGDPAILFADATKIGTELGWKARYTEIDPIVETAWHWFKNHPDGYGD